MEEGTIKLPPCFSVAWWKVLFLKLCAGFACSWISFGGRHMCLNMRHACGMRVACVRHACGMRLRTLKVTLLFKSFPQTTGDIFPFWPIHLKVDILWWLRYTRFVPCQRNGYGLQFFLKKMFIYFLSDTLMVKNIRFHKKFCIYCLGMLIIMR